MARTLGGSFGTVHEELDVNFPYFGTMIRVNPDFSPRELAEWGKLAESFDEENPDFAVMDDAADAILRCIVHPDDFATFKTLAAQNRQEVWDLIEVATQLITAVTEVPTVQPSGSSGGLTSTEQSSVVVSSSPVVTRLEAQGRPDLALVVVQAQEHRSA